MNPYYDHGSVPATGATGSSAAIRAELDAIEAGFDKLPTLSGYGNKAVVVNAGGTALTTTSGSMSLAGDLTLAGAFTTSGAYGLTFTLSALTSLTLPTSGTVATLAGTETFTNKTLTSPILTAPALGTPASGVLTNCTGLPISTGVAGLAANIAAFLGTPSSANLAAAITDETGSGALVFGTSPTIAGPTISNPVLSGSATGTYTLAGTPTITGPAISNPVLSGSATGTYTLAGTPTITGPAISNPVLSGTITGTYTLGGTPTISGMLVAGTPLVQNPIAVNASVTQAHGLGAQPTLVISYFECLSADANYSVGDRVRVDGSMYSDSNSANYQAWLVTADATNLVLITSTGNTAPIFADKSTRTQTFMTAAKWKFVSTPYKLN